MGTLLSYSVLVLLTAAVNAYSRFSEPCSISSNTVTPSSTSLSSTKISGTLLSCRLTSTTSSTSCSFSHFDEYSAKPLKHQRTSSNTLSSTSSDSIAVTEMSANHISGSTRLSSVTLISGTLATLLTLSGSSGTDISATTESSASSGLTGSVMSTQSLSSVIGQTTLSTVTSTTASTSTGLSIITTSALTTDIGATAANSVGLSATLSISSATSASTITNGCGAVSQYYGQTAADWSANDMDAWLNEWWTQNTTEISSSGFASAFGDWAVGNPDFNCQDDGSNSDCDFDPCGIATLNGNPDVRQAYYVMESLNRLHTYFTGLGQAFTTSAIAAALSKDSWAETFYTDPDVKSVSVLREILNVLTVIVGIGAALAGLGAGVVGVIGSAAGALFTGGVASATPLLGQHQDDTFKKSADLGAILSEIVVGAMEGFTSANNLLMEGQNYDNTGDLRSYFAGGTFVDFPGVDKNAVTNAMNTFLIGNSINNLWKAQKIFIMGGGACGDGQGIGSGPQEATVCRNGQAWYLYYWEEDVNAVVLTSHKWGWVASPPGADSLGTGDYAGISIADVINSSLDANNVAGFNYDNATAYARVQSALEGQWANPGAQGPSWEGTFAIPVCDVSSAIDSTYFNKDYILQPYGEEMRPVWCGPICDGNLTTTQAFIAAAQMTNFDSPKHLCPTKPGY